MSKGNGNGLLLAAAGAGALLAAREVIRRSREYDMRGRVVLITGGSRGLGLVLARALGREGARVAICARDLEELDRARRDLQQRGTTVLALPCDVSNQAEVEELVREVSNHFGRIDVLINNAGVIEVGPMEVMTLEDYDHAMKVHFWGPLYSVLAVLPQMKQRGEGRIVNISSIGGKISVPHLLPYSASKFALVGLSEGLRAELAKDGIVVTTVCPGLMRTGSPRNAIFKGKHRAEYAWFTISDSLPVTSMKAERAARQIISACKRGEAEVILSIPAKLAALFHGLFPGLTADLLGLTNRLLPGPGGIGKDRALGEESQSKLAPSWLTALSEQAARDNNEIA
ncbi:MAG TPA: SDR family NAD(P)-dependent oxidoreductase [Blastocatellia bacterium]|jgi:NAD(P)-dependent dehydrogenase (short-subunit alcohol dehydrogenase family)|nr:SDR family NAD(P)-dependent oxidoreductase [Blastocatellia bacterium]